MSCPYAPEAIRVDLGDRVIHVEPGTRTLAVPIPPRQIFGTTVIRHYTLRTFAGIRCDLGHFHTTEAIAVFLDGVTL